MEGLELLKQLIPGSVQDAGGQALGKFHNLLALLEYGALGGLNLSDTYKYATKRPLELGLEGDHRGQADALRHILLAAELQRTHPYLAAPLLYGHEFFTNTLQGQPSEEREQDVYNNEIGLQLGKLAKNRQDVERMALIGLKKAKVLPEQPYGQY